MIFRKLINILTFLIKGYYPMKPNRCHNLTKQQARLETVINPYRKFKHSQLPSNKEYWTLCNTQGLDDIHELGQLVNSNLITQSQFHGVDANPLIIRDNKTNLPIPNWYTGYFKEVFFDALDDKHNPGLIYFDTTSMARIALKESFSIMQKISDCNIDDVMLVVNFISKNAYGGNTDELSTVLEKIRDSNAWRILYENTDWKLIPTVISYKSGRTIMTNLIFIKP